MRPEIIRPLRYCTGIKCLPCTAMMMCWKIRASINFYAGARRGEPGGAGLHRLHTEALWTQTYLTWPGRSQWLILTPGGFTLCDKGSKNVNKLSVSANLSYYLRTAGEKICLVDKCLFSWQKRAQSTNTLWRRKILIRCQIKCMWRRFSLSPSLCFFSKFSTLE